MSELERAHSGRRQRRRARRDHVGAIALAIGRLAILKGTPNADLCREFIKFALAPERQAIFAKATGYGPTIPQAIDHIDAAIAKTLPTHPENRKSSILVDVDFWAKTRDAATERFNKWVVS